MTVSHFSLRARLPGRAINFSDVSTWCGPKFTLLPAVLSAFQQQLLTLLPAQLPDHRGSDAKPHLSWLIFAPASLGQGRNTVTVPAGGCAGLFVRRAHFAPAVAGPCSSPCGGVIYNIYLTCGCTWSNPSTVLLPRRTGATLALLWKGRWKSMRC